MKPLKVNPAVFILLLALTGKLGATVAFVTAPSSLVTANDTSQLSAVAYDSTGAGMPSATFKWSVSNSSVLSVDANGLVTALSLGWSDIYADTPGARGTIRLQVVPLAIIVHPSNQTIHLGDTLQFSADALDVNAQPLPGVSLLWRAYGANAGTNNGIGIDSSGSAYTFGWGTFFIEAYFNYTAGTGPFPQRVVGTTLLTVLPTSSFSAKKLLDTSVVRQGFQLREHRGQMSVNDAGQIAYTGFLEGFATASLLYSNASGNGTFTALGVAGVAAELPGTNLQDLGEPALNNNGQVASVCVVASPRGCLFFANPDGTSHQIFFDGASANGVLNVRNFAVTRFALNDSANLLFRADYYDIGSTVTKTGLFVTNSSGQAVPVVPAATPLPGLGSTYTFDRDFGLANDGTILFFATSGASRALYRLTTDQTITRVVGTGDTVAGAKVLSLANVVLGRNGQYAIEVNNGSQYLLLYAGDPAKYQQLAVTNWNQAYAVSGAGEVAFVCSLAQGYGVYRWNGSTVAPVLMQQSPSPSGDLYAQFDSAAITAKGEVIVQARIANSILVVVNAGTRFGAKQTVVFQSGSLVNAAAGPSFYNFILNNHSGNPLIKTGWYQFNAWEVAPGAMIPRIVSGDRTPNGWFFEGVGDVRQNAEGDLFIGTDEGLEQISGGKSTLLAHYPQRTTNGFLYSPSQVAANGKGDVACMGGTSFGVNALSLVKNGVLTPVAFLGSSGGIQTNAPGGGYFSASPYCGRSDDGTLYAYLRVAGGTDGLFSWNGKTWVSVLRVGDASGAGTVTNIYSMRVAGRVLYATMATSSAQTQKLARFQDGQWTDVVSVGDTLPGAGLIGGVGAWDVNRNGSVAIQLYINGGDVYIASVNSASMVPVADTEHALSTAELLPVFYNLSIHDDSRIFAIAINQQDQMVLYEFDPLP